MNLIESFLNDKGVSLSGEFALHLFSGKVIEVDNIKNIKSVAEGEIKIKLKKGGLAILGAGLRVVEIGEKSVIIEGEIKSVVKE